MFPHEEHLVVALQQTNNNVILLLNDLMALWTTNVILANSSPEEVKRVLGMQKMIQETIEKFPNNNEN